MCGQTMDEPAALKYPREGRFFAKGEATGIDTIKRGNHLFLGK